MTTIKRARKKIDASRILPEDLERLPFSVLAADHLPGRFQAVPEPVKIAM
jgi:hypothetical protein